MANDVPRGAKRSKPQRESLKAKSFAEIDGPDVQQVDIDGAAQDELDDDCNSRLIEDVDHDSPTEGASRKAIRMGRKRLEKEPKNKNLKPNPRARKR